MTLTTFPTWPVDGPPPVPPVHGLIPAASAPAAGIRIVVDTTQGPADENDIAPDDAGLETGLFRAGDGSIQMRHTDGSVSTVYVPEYAGRERWLSGVAVYPYPVDVPSAWNACYGTSQATKAFGTGKTPPEFAAITLSLPISCTTQQVPDQAAFRARAVAVMTATESWGLAREFMSGATVLGPTGSPFLADTTCTLLNGSLATKPNHGIQLLEEAISATGRLGLIHCSPMMATALLGQGFALRDTTGVIRTINGNVVIPDAGYSGVSKPVLGNTPAKNQEWAYCTGPLDIRRSEIFTTPDTVAQAVDRGTGAGASNGRPNNVTYRAERYLAIDWDTALHAAVLVDRCLTDCVTSS
jgi:hypothetical protein